MKLFVENEVNHVNHHAGEVIEKCKMIIQLMKDVNHSFTLHGLEGEDVICLARS